MANTDIRIDINFCDNPKTKRLIRKLGHEGFFCIIKLWAVSARLYPKGILAKCDCIDIADLAGWNGDPEEFCNTLVSEKTNFLDLEDGVYSLHDWEENQPWVYNSDIRSGIAKKNIEKRWNKKKKTNGIKKEYEPYTNGIQLVDTVYPIGNTPSPLPSPSPLPIPFPKKKDIYVEIQKAYHEHCKKLPEVFKITDKRKSSINSLLQEFTIDQIIEAFKKAGKSSFINGDNKSTWKASFDWIINKNNMLKIVEGNYDNKGKKVVSDINSVNADWIGVPEL